MTMLIGGQPGRIYTGEEIAAGKASLGQRLMVKDATSGGDKEYVLCLVAASQNLISGHVVTINGGFTVTVAAVATANTRRDQLGVAITTQTSVTATASASTYIWVQVYGRTSVITTVSATLGTTLKIGTTAGVVTSLTAPVTASAFIHGMVLTATGGTQGTVCAAILSYPSYTGII